VRIGQGKYVRTDVTNPTGIARCDYTGFIVQRDDLVKQMAYSGSGLYWTGLLVHYKYMDMPNPSSLAPVFKPDPEFITDPRPSEEVQGNQQTSLTQDVTGTAELTLGFGELSHTPLIVTGTPSSDPFSLFLFRVPGAWVVENKTTSVVNVSFLPPISDDLNPAFAVPVNTAEPFWSDGEVLQQTPYFNT